MIASRCLLGLPIRDRDGDKQATSALAGHTHRYVELCNRDPHSYNTPLALVVSERTMGCGLPEEAKCTTHALHIRQQRSGRARDTAVQNRWR